jgi:hypothetical protein
MKRRDLIPKRDDLFFWLSIIWLAGLCGAAGWQIFAPLYLE